MAGRQGFEPRSDGPEPPVLPLDDLPALRLIVENAPDRFKTKHGHEEMRKSHLYLDPRSTIFAQASRKVTVRLKIGAPGLESGSTQK
jgi:hypothetical protein